MTDYSTELRSIRPLTSEAYDQARQTAIERINKRIGTKPTRKDFRRELGALWTPLEAIAVVVFCAALAISSVHIIAYMGDMAAASYPAADDALAKLTGAGSAGIRISPDVWAVVHQIGAILLAEAAALLFMTSHSMNRERRAHLPAWRRWFSIPLLLAFMAGAFVLVANLSSGVNWFVSILPPVFTLGLGVYLESLIARSLRRRDDISTRYLEALTTWEKASKDATAHPEFKSMFAQEIWAALLRGRGMQAYADVPLAIRRAAVRRELQRETWAADIDNLEGEAVPTDAPLASSPVQPPMSNGKH